ncbi:MAG: type IV pilus modification PilV family protein [Candidatus Aminicenantales bacterium]
MNKKTNTKGFSLIEVLVGIALIAIVMIGLAQIFTMSVMNNLRSSELSNGTFLAQQQVDYLRTLLQAELNDFPQTARGEANDEQLDTNQDGTADFRRITDIAFQGNFYEAQVLVFAPVQAGVSRTLLLQDPEQYHVKARLHTLIGR